MVWRVVAAIPSQMGYELKCGSVAAIPEIVVSGSDLDDVNDAVLADGLCDLPAALGGKTYHGRPPMHRSAIIPRCARVATDISAPMTLPIKRLHAHPRCTPVVRHHAAFHHPSRVLRHIRVGGISESLRADLLEGLRNFPPRPNPEIPVTEHRFRPLRPDGNGNAITRRRSDRAYL
jgi:hypothetical protein